MKCLTRQSVVAVIAAALLWNASVGSAAEKKDIVDTAVAAGSFKTLATALKAAGLIEALKGKGPFTVFAPTDEAFAKLPPGTVETLLEPDNKEKLISILKYHVVPGRVYSEDAVAAKKATTLQGGDLSIIVSDGQAMVNGAKIVATDIDASNGVIHVIDSVILPKRTTR
jgi:transforming growth factor-beta-induced protein